MVTLHNVRSRSLIERIAARLLGRESGPLERSWREVEANPLTDTQKARIPALARSSYAIPQIVKDHARKRLASSHFPVHFEAGTPNIPTIHL